MHVFDTDKVSINVRDTKLLLSNTSLLALQNTQYARKSTRIKTNIYPVTDILNTQIFAYVWERKDKAENNETS